MEQRTVLPAAFGLVARNDEAVRGRLVENAALFREQLERVAGKVEMSVRVSWNTPDLIEYFVTTHPELGAARERLKDRTDVGREELIAVGKLFERLREAARERHSERVVAALQEPGVELKLNPPRGEREVMNLSCLVSRERLSAFEKAFETTAAGFDDHFTFELNGPWAPHSFTELNTAASAA